MGCNNCILLTFHISHSLFTSTEKEMKSMILDLNVLVTWVFNFRAKAKTTSMNGVPREDYHDDLGNVEIVLS